MAARAPTLVISIIPMQRGVKQLIAALVVLTNGCVVAGGVQYEP